MTNSPLSAETNLNPCYIFSGAARLQLSFGQGWKKLAIFPRSFRTNKNDMRTLSTRFKHGNRENSNWFCHLAYPPLHIHLQNEWKVTVPLCLDRIHHRKHYAILETQILNNKDYTNKWKHLLAFIGWASQYHPSPYNLIYKGAIGSLPLHHTA